jgi:hypothetical protein
VERIQPVETESNDFFGMVTHFGRRPLLTLTFGFGLGSTLNTNAEEYELSNDCHFNDLPLFKCVIHGKRRVTRCLYTTSTLPTTTIERQRLYTHNNTIALRINTKRRTCEGETETSSGKHYHMQGS